ncbi:hypothetical protein GOBAR_AA09511 [Gossypium barbadense]|uniref:Uncharacterized protein n=1 Tax=Gossypium barbadense TaxID=3634 RepID=A0A2P5Y6C0_GOSBA|nr:hypothetical protein GOBAR_AA09511 [Gossypium barbadense]
MPISYRNKNEPKTKRPRSYELVDNLLQPPFRKKSLPQQSFGCLWCGQQIQSILRRKRGDEAGFTYEAKKYLASSKKVKKLRNKSLKACKCGFSLLENDVEAAFSMLGKVQGVTFTVFESLFSHINGTKMESKSTNWSLLSKLMSSKRVTHKGEATETNEFEKVGVILCTLIGNKTRKIGKMSIDDAQIELQKLESSIQDLEDGVTAC